MTDLDNDLIEIIAHLRERVQELEDGSCRFNCRLNKDAFRAGWARAIGVDEMCAEEEPYCAEAYKEWNEQK